VSAKTAPPVTKERRQDTDQEKLERVTKTFLKMKKFDIGELKEVFEGR